MKEHKHVIIRAEVSRPIEKESEAVEFMYRLIDAIDMKTLIPPQAVYDEQPDNEGVTAFAVITTSHIALHVWTVDKVAQLDLYSCKSFDPRIVRDLMDEFMGITSVSSALVLRDEKIIATTLNLE